MTESAKSMTGTGWITIIMTVIFILVSVTATSILLLFSIRPDGGGKFKETTGGVFEGMDISGRDISDSGVSYYHTVSYERLDGYILNSPNILPLTKYDTSYNSPYYDPNNYDVQYHSMYEGNGNTSKESGIWVKNPAGKLEFLLWTDVSNYSTYYKPGAFKYGPSNYVPSYEDTVYLNKYKDGQVVQYQK
jgi:hypothetical protein